MRKLIPILTLALTITILVHQVQSCFITHFVYYGNLSYIDYTRVSAFPYPYIMHLNQDIRFPNNYTLNKTLTPVEKSDIKKMQVIYHHGGLYIDNDHLIDMPCIRNIFCPLSQGLYVMDWTDRLGDVWHKSVPISFIYSNTAKNNTIQQILTSYNQSDKQAVDFSGPFHAQKYRDGFKFVKVNRSCEYHYGMMTWSTGLSMETVWFRRKTQQIKQKLQLNTQQQQQEQQIRNMYIKLWNSHCVLYPHNFNYKAFIELDRYYNHVEIVDRDNMIFKVIQYSYIKQTQNKLRQVVRKYQGKNKQNKQNKGQYNSNRQKQNKLWFDLYEQGQFNNNNNNNNSNVNNSNNVNKKDIKLQLCLMLLIIVWIVLVCKIVDGVCATITRYRQQYRYRQVVNQSSPTQLNTSDNIIQTINNNNNNNTNTNNNNSNNNNNTNTSNNKNSNITTTINNNNRIQQNNDNLCCSINEQIKYKCALLAILSVLLLYLLYAYHSRQSIIEISEYQHKYGIYAQKLQHTLNNSIVLQQYGITNHIQIQSHLSYFNSTHFQQLLTIFKQQYLHSLQHQIYSYPYNPSLQAPPTHLQYLLYSNTKQLQQQLKNIQKLSNRPKVTNNTYSYLASYLYYNHQYNNTIELQYYYYNKTYQLDTIHSYQHICILSVIYQQYNAYMYQQWIDTIYRQNYTNYQIILIDDSTNHNYAQQVHQYLRTNTTLGKIRNRIKIVRNKHKISQLGSVYKWVSLCEQGSIVMSINMWAQLVGHQALNIINAVYLNQSIYYAHVNYLIQPNFTSRPKIGQYLLSANINTSDYRTMIDLNKTHLITFRKQLIHKIPVQQLIQYHYNKHTHMLVPKFYYQSAHKILAYSMLQLAGNYRYAIVKQPLYVLQQNSYQSCGKQKQKYIQFKSRFKYPLSTLEHIDSQPKYMAVKQLNIFQQLLTKFKNIYSLYYRCLAVYDPPHNLL